MASVSLRRRLEALETRMLPDVDRVAFALYCKALDGDEPARVQLVELCNGFSGKSRMNELADSAGLLAGPFDPMTLVNETGDFCFQAQEGDQQ